MVTVGWPITVTRGLGTVGCAWPPCEQSTVAPTCRRNPGIDLLPPSASDDDQRAVVDGDGRTRHDDARSLAVLDVDAGVVDDDRRAGGALQHDAAGGAGQVADYERVLQHRLDDDVWVPWYSG